MRKRFEWVVGETSACCAATRLVRIGRPISDDVEKELENSITHEVLHCLIFEAMGVEQYMKLSIDAIEMVICEMNPAVYRCTDEGVRVLTHQEAFEEISGGREP